MADFDDLDFDAVVESRKKTRPRAAGRAASAPPAAEPTSLPAAAEEDDGLDFDAMVAQRQKPNQPGVPTDARAGWAPTKLSAGDEARFQNDMRTGEGYRQWREEVTKLWGREPDYDDPENDYDYRGAWQAGVRPAPYQHDGGRYHWGSSAPDGRMLKAPDHPTAWMEYFMRETGQDPGALGLKTPEEGEAWKARNTPGRGLLGRKTQQPTDPLDGFLEDLRGGSIAAMQGLYGNVLDEVRPYMQFPDDSIAPKAEEYRRAAEEYPAAHTAGQIAQGVGASMAVPGSGALGVAAQGTTQGALAAGNQYADNHDWTDTILAGLKGGVLGGALTHVGNLAGNLLARPSLAAINPTVDDLKNAWAAKGRPMPEPQQVPLSQLPPDPVRAAMARQAQEAAAAAEPPALVHGPPAKDPFHGRQAEINALPPEPAPPMVAGPPAADPFHGRAAELARTPPEPMGPPPPVVHGPPAKDPFYGRQGKLARTPEELPPEVATASPIDPFVEGGAFKKQPENAWWMDREFAQSPPDTGMPDPEGLLPTGKAPPRWAATIDLPPGRGHNRKFALDAELPPRPVWSEAEAAETLQTARVPKPKRPEWTEPEPPAPDLPLELAADVPIPLQRRTERSWSAPEDVPLELAAEVPPPAQRTWTEPELEPLELAFEPTHAVHAETPGYLQPSFVETVKREEYAKLAKLPNPQANAPATQGNVLEVLGIVKGGMAGRAIRAGARLAGIGGPSPRQLAIQSGALVPNQTVKQVAYASAPTLNYALQAVLSSGRAKLPAKEQQELAGALVEQDQNAIASLWFRLQQLIPGFAREVEGELNGLNKEE